MKYKRVLAILLAILTVFASPPPLSAAQPRAGDAAGHWAEAAINRGLSQGLVNMDADGLVKPDAYMTRAEFCYSLDRWISKNGELLRALGVKWKPFRPGTFYDLPTSHPFYINVRQVYGMWLIESDTLNFNPEGFMTRAGICYPWVSLFMMMESSSINRVYFAGLDEDAALAAFSDGGSVADEYRQAVAAMTDLNFISGYPTGAFNPDAYLTRAEAYSIFMTIEEQLATYVDGDRSLSLLRVSSSRSGADGLLIEVVGDNQGLTEDAAITLLYTTTPGVGVTPSNIHTLYANRVTVKITELLASGNSTANNYRVPLYLDESTTYYVHAMISDRGRTSEVLSCVVGGRESSAYAYNNGYTSGGALSFPVALPNEIRLLSASAPPTSAGTVDVSVAVNDAAISNNADVVITYTADTRRNMTEQELLAVMGTIGNGYNSVVKRISAMTERGAGVYSALADTLGPGVYTFYVMLRSGDYHTPIQSFMVLVTNPSGFSLVDAAGFIRNNDDGKPVGIDMRLTVSPQAAYRDTEVIYAYTLDENMRVDSTTIGQSAGGLTSVTATLGDMRALAPTIYAKDIDLSVNGPWYFHVMLRRGDEVSEIKSFTVMLQSGEPEPIIKDVTGIALDLPANLPPYSEEDGTKTLHVTAGQFMELHAVVTPFDAEDGAVTWSAEPVEDGVNSNYTLEFVRDESGEIIPEKEIAYRFIYFDEPGIVKITVETAGEEFKDSVIIVVDPVDSTPAEEIEQITPQRFNLFVYDVPDDPMYNEYEDNHINILWRPEPLGSEYLSAVWSKGEGDDDNDEIIKLDPNTGHVMAVGESKPDDDPDAEPGALKPVRVILTVTLKDGSTLEPSVWYVTVLRKQVDINAIELKIMAEDGDTPDELEIQVEQRHRLRIKPEPPQAAPNVTWHIRYEPGSEPGEGEDAPIIIDRDSGVVSVRGMGEAVVWAESTVYEGVISNELKIITKPIEFERISVPEVITVDEEMTLTVAPPNATLSNIDWSNPEPEPPGVVTITEEGGRYVIKGISPGVATVTAVSKDNPTNTREFDVTVLPKVERVAAGGDRSFAVVTVGEGTQRLYTWTGPYGDDTVFTEVSGITGTITDIKTTGTYHAAITSDGKLWIWGGYPGEADDLTEGAPKATPAQVTWLTNASKVSLGLNHMLVLTTDGATDSAVYGWGTAADALGPNYGFVDLDEPLYTVDPKATAIAAGTSHSLIVNENGEVFVWGDGINADDAVDGLTGIQAVHAGDNTSFVINDSGAVYTWGEAPASTPAQIAGLPRSGCREITGADDNMLALYSNFVYSFGADSAPVQIRNFEVTNIAAGEGFSLAADETGRLFFWDNDPTQRTRVEITEADPAP